MIFMIIINDHNNYNDIYDDYVMMFLIITWKDDDDVLLPYQSRLFESVTTFVYMNKSKINVIWEEKGFAQYLPWRMI